MNQFNSRHNITSNIAGSVDQGHQLPLSTATMRAARIGRAALMSGVAAISFAAYSTTAEAACVPVVQADLNGGAQTVTCDAADMIVFKNGTLTLGAATDLDDGDIDIGLNGILIITAGADIDDSGGDALETARPTSRLRALPATPFPRMALNPWASM